MKKEFKVFSIEEDILTEKICQELEALGNENVRGKILIDTFSDGEKSPQFLETIRDKTVFLVCSTTTPEKILSLLLAIDAAKRAAATEIVALMPYFGYGRQDKKEGARGAIGARLMATLIESAGATRVMTMEMHSQQVQGFFSIPVDHLNGSKIFPLDGMVAENYAIASPDAGGVNRTIKLTTLFGKSTDERKESYEVSNVFCIKHREKPNEISQMKLIGEVIGKFVIFTDDMVDTGGTILKGAELCIKNGAIGVGAFITHPVLSKNSADKINSSDFLNWIVVSDTIFHENLPEKFKVVSSSRMFARAIDTVVSHKSLNSVN